MSADDAAAAPIKPRRAVGRKGVAARLLLLAGMIAVLAAVLDLDEARRILARVEWPWFVAALAVGQVSILLSAWRWRYTAARLGLDLRMRRAAGDYYLTCLLNMVVPGGVAGDIVRTVRTARLPEATTRAAVRSVVLERLAGQAAFWTVATAGFVAWAVLRGTALPAGSATALAILPAIGVVGAVAVAVAAARGPMRVRNALAEIGPDVRRCLLSPGAFVVQTAAGLAIVGSFIATFALGGLAIGAPLDPLEAVGLVPLVLVTMLLPITIGGWGLREGAAALLLPLAGLTATEGASVAALYGVVTTLAALPGVVPLVASLAAPRDQAPDSRA